MATWVVGDIQGCLDCLLDLLARARFDPAADRLYAVGDLVNRGPRSLETLRFCRSLGAAFQSVLGNHDLHLLAVARGGRPLGRKDTLGEILTAPDREELLDWLQRRPLLLRLGRHTLVHAGIPPQWTLEEAAARAGEVEAVLRDAERAPRFLAKMYGDHPRRWRDDLQGTERLRCIVNYLTRMRYCDAEGRLELANKRPPHQGPAGYYPWFAVPGRRTAGQPILFGHWASLGGETGREDAIALDTGCVWGGRLRLLCLESGVRLHHDCGPCRP